MTRYDVPVGRGSRTAVRREELETLARRRNAYRRFVNFSVRRLLPAALVVLFGTATYQALTLPDFNVDRIEVTGNRIVTYADVLAAANIPTGNIFLLDRATVRASIAKIKRLESVEVRLLLPATVDITVLERRPAAVWQTDGQRFLVDENGLVLGPAGGELLPTVNDLDGELVAVEDRVSVPVVDAARAAVSAIPAELGQPVMAVDYRRNEGLSFMSERGWRAVLGIAPPTAELETRQQQAQRQQEYIVSKVRMLRAVTDVLMRDRVQPGHVDVRFGDRPYVR